MVTAGVSGGGGGCGVDEGLVALGRTVVDDLLGGAGCVSSETAPDLGKVLDGAGNVFDTLFVVGSVWYMLRFFR